MQNILYSLLGIGEQHPLGDLYVSVKSSRLRNSVYNLHLESLVDRVLEQYHEAILGLERQALERGLLSHIDVEIAMNGWQAQLLALEQLLARVQGQGQILETLHELTF